MPLLSTETTTEKRSKTQTVTRKETPWNVVVFDDPVNLMEYVVLVFKRVFGYSAAKANRMMLEVHEQGRSIVWTGGREKGEFYVQQLHGLQLRATLEKAS